MTIVNQTGRQQWPSQGLLTLNRKWRLNTCYYYLRHLARGDKVYRDKSPLYHHPSQSPSRGRRHLVFQQLGSIVLAREGILVRKPNKGLSKSTQCQNWHSIPITWAKASLLIWFEITVLNNRIENYPYLTYLCSLFVLLFSRHIQYGISRKWRQPQRWRVDAMADAGWLIYIYFVYGFTVNLIFVLNLGSFD